MSYLESLAPLPGLVPVRRFIRSPAGGWRFSGRPSPNFGLCARIRKIDAARQVARRFGALNRLLQINRRVFKAYLLKESLEQLWNYRYEGAMANYLRKWIDQLRWQRLPSFQKLATMLLDHID